VKVGAQDWVDQIAVGAVGLFIHPLLITAAIDAMQQRNALHDVLTAIDQHIRYQQPQAQVGEPPTPLMHGEMAGSSVRLKWETDMHTRAGGAQRRGPDR